MPGSSGAADPATSSTPRSSSCAIALVRVSGVTTSDPDRSISSARFESGLSSRPNHRTLGRAWSDKGAKRESIGSQSPIGS